MSFKNYTPSITRPLRAPSPSSALIQYEPWMLQTQITLSRDAATLLNLTAPPPDLPLTLTHTQRPIQAPTTTFSPTGDMETTLYIERILTRKVAVVTDCAHPITPTSPRWAAKFYFDDAESVQMLRHELNAYAAGAPIYGTAIPVFYGHWTFPRGKYSVLLLEFISPGTTITSLRDALPSILDRDPQRLARFRLLELHSSATSAVNRINTCGVVHGDLFGENMVISEDDFGVERVVMVDFSRAIVYGVDGGRTKFEYWISFHMSFMPEFGTGRTWHG